LEKQIYKGKTSIKFIMDEKSSYIPKKKRTYLEGERRKIRLYNELLKELLRKEGWEQISEFEDDNQKIYGFEKGEGLKVGNTIPDNFLKEEKRIDSFEEVKRVYISNVEKVKLLTDSGVLSVDIESLLTYYSRNVIELL